MSTQSEVLLVVNMIGAAYPNFSPTKETIAVYYELLKDLPADLLEAAALQCCSENGRKFAPSVGELRGAASTIMAKTNGIPSALEAWDETKRSPRDGYNRKTYEENGEFIIEKRPYVWSHPLVERVARMLGFPEFPNPENESIDRAHFLKQYEIELERYAGNEIELPEVTRYIESHANSNIKQLVKGMEK